MIKKLNSSDFFKKLTNISEISLVSGSNYSDDVFVDEACRFISELPLIFSDQLDRMTMWDRIGNGIETSISKSGGNFRLFVNYIIDYIKADYSKFAAHSTLNNIINAYELREKEWQRMFIDNMKKFSFLIIAKSRQMWNNKKLKTKVEEIIEDEDI
jgi:hypothetical protein